MVDVVKWVDSTVRRRSANESLESDARRAQIVTAAINAIEDLGAQVGMTEIAKRAGLPRPNIYRHFASREQLDAEVARFAGTELTRRIRPGLARPGTLREVIRNAITPCVGWAAEHPNLYRFLTAQQQTTGALRGGPSLLAELVEAMNAYIRSTGLSVSPPDGLLAGQIGMVDSSIIWWLDHHDEDKDELVDRLTRQIAVVFIDTFAHLGFDVPEDMKLEPEQ